ncbi:MAG TPA: 3-dehydroquinate synthase [Candidatus Saccharimonadales bacterium]|nr:3-dehydroquinate synthase [Candidatus Saccharimonadales bacterium]
MKKLTISFTPPASNREYPIFTGTGLISDIAKLVDLSAYSKVIIITDEIVAPHYLEKLQNALQSHAEVVMLPPGESAKDITYLSKIWQGMIDAKLDRKSLVINLGGGVIGDIGGFAASTYMRGIAFINIPTTLLAQVDESVGGKTMIDFYGIKNIVGTFYQPSAVIIDVETLQSLPKRQILSGFAEIIKHGIIRDEDYFQLVTSKKPMDFSKTELIDIIERSNEIKSEIVQNDENENGLRKIVNFGHSIGHAIEALSLGTDKPLLHGEAVSIGMVIESNIAVKVGLLPKSDAEVIKQSLHDVELPVEIPDFKTEDIIEKMKLDKKNLDGKMIFTLLKKIGEGVINQTVTEETIREVITAK